MKFIVTGGGTGGHIYSAIATADEIKKRQPDADIIFVGSKYYMETRIIPKTGYPLKTMPLRRWNHSRWWKNYKFPFEVLISLYQSYRLIKSFKPDAIIGTGGFATGPVLKMAQWLNIPTFIQEHNAFPGVTTKLLAKKATRIQTAYVEIENYLKTDNILLTGNPIRQDLYNLPDQRNALQKFGLHPDKFTIFVIGGSLGGKPINDTIIKILPELKKQDIQILMQTGRKNYHWYQNIKDAHIKILPFIENMAEAFASADLIISQSGAMMISELSLVKKPVIMVPLYDSTQNHQEYNAKALVKKKAVHYVNEKELDKKLLPAILQLYTDPKIRKQLSENLNQFAFPDATKVIVDDIFNYLKKRHKAL